jgi:hypothetical protein
MHATSAIQGWEKMDDEWSDEELNDCDTCDKFADEWSEAVASRNTEQEQHIDRQWDEHKQRAHPD